jgi:hypothetical protein
MLIFLSFLVYNEEDNDLYVHHDILLDTFPLALEWLNFDPENDDKQGSLLDCVLDSSISSKLFFLEFQ